MGTKEASEIRVGNILKIDGQPFKVISQEIRGTGKSGKTVHLRAKGLMDNRLLEKTYRTEEKVEEVEIHYSKLQYLYKDGEAFFFMDNETFEQSPLSAKAIGRQEIFLKENMEVTAITVEGKPVSIEFPKTVELKVVSSPPSVTGSSNYKEVELENGLKILVPQFVKEGESVRINTEDFSYMDRVTLKSMKSDAIPGKKKEE